VGWTGRLHSGSAAQLNRALDGLQVTPSVRAPRRAQGGIRRGDGHSASFGRGAALDTTPVKAEPRPCSADAGGHNAGSAIGTPK
jgi:hypothetical protein